MGFVQLESVMFQFYYYYVTIIIIILVYIATCPLSVIYHIGVRSVVMMIVG